MAENHFIKFLSAYGPSSNSNNMYDEFVVEASNIANIDPLAIPENYSEDIFKKLLSNEAFSIILTGTAGDGKTYTARQVLNLMNQNFNKSETWSNNQSVFDFSLADRKITFIKDMSEMSVSQKQEHIPKIIDSFTQKNPNNLYVICVNDGQLLKIWRDHIDFLKKQNDSPYNLINQTQQLLNDIQDLLKDDAKSHPRYSFELINMSRRSHSETLDHIIDTISDHNAWSKCEGCPAKINHSCPILKNKNELALKDEASLRERLKSLLLLTASNDEHLSIRQLLILVVNILLGDTENPENPILNCSRAQKRARDAIKLITTDENRQKSIKKINIFDNVFAENLTISKRMQYTVFSTLAKFGIGFESSKFFERRIAEEDLLSTHMYAIDIKSLRREFFFKFKANPSDDSPWNLTKYKYAYLYIDALNNNNIDDIKKKLVKGLNRILHQSYCITEDALWLIENSNIHQGISYLNLRSFEPIPIKRQGFGYFLDISNSNKVTRPLNLDIMQNKKDTIFSIEINPVIFEYIIQVSEGLFLNGTSNDKLKDIKSFQIRCIVKIKKFFEKEDIEISSNYIVQVDDEGYLTSKEILILDTKKESINEKPRK